MAEPLIPSGIFPTATTDEELWQQVLQNKRKLVLEQVRKAEPDTARNWLMQTWPQEDAGNKIELMLLLGANYQRSGY